MKIVEFLKKHPKKIIFILLIILIWIFSPIRYCTFPRDGGPGSSESIEESKLLKVFIGEYKSEKNNIIVDENVFKIENIWLEKLWCYSRDYRFPIIDDISVGVNLIITTNRNLSKHGIEWRFENFCHIYGDIEYGHQIEREMKWAEVKDTLFIKILKMNPKTNEFTDSIGVIRFFKVKK